MPSRPRACASRAATVSRSSSVASHRGPWSSRCQRPESSTYSCTKEEGSRVTAGRNSIPLNTAKTTAFMLTPTTSVITTASEIGAVLRMERKP